MISEERRLRSSFPRSERIPIVTLSKSMRSAALGACIGAETCGAATDMACGPRWMRAVCALEGVCECREFMQGSADQTWQFRPFRRVKPFVSGGWQRPGTGDSTPATGDGRPATGELQRANYGFSGACPTSVAHRPSP